MRMGRPIQKPPTTSDEQYIKELRKLQNARWYALTEERKILRAFGLMGITLPNGTVIDPEDDADVDYSEANVETRKYQIRQTFLDQQVHKFDWDRYNELEEAKNDLDTYVENINNGHKQEMTRPRPDWGMLREGAAIDFEGYERSRRKCDARIDEILRILGKRQVDRVQEARDEKEGEHGVGGD